MIPANTAPATIHKILDRLSRDHAFRELMLGDPAAALKEFGVEVDASRIPHVRKLPSMAACAQVSKSAESNALEAAHIIIFCR